MCAACAPTAVNGGFDTMAVTVSFLRRFGLVGSVFIAVGHSRDVVGDMSGYLFVSIRTLAGIATKRRAVNKRGRFK